MSVISLKFKVDKAYTAIETGQVSQRYRPVDSEAVMAKMQSILEAQGLNYSVRTVYPRGNKSTTHWMEYTLQGQGLSVLGDSITPRVLLRNSYQGESSLRIMVGFLRLACSNGLIIGNSFLNERIIHVQGDTGDNRLLELPLKVERTINYVFNTFVKDLEKATAKTISNPNGHVVIDRLGFSDRLTKQVNQAWDYPTRQEDKGSTIWSLWNIVNEQVRLASRSDFRINEKNVHLLDTIITESNKLVG